MALSFCLAIKVFEKEKKMKKASLITVMAIVMMVTFCGCEDEQRQRKTGFLSDYSKLKVESEDTLRYLPAGQLGRYSKFIIEPVAILRHSSSKSKATSHDLAHLKQYMYTAVHNAVTSSYQVVTRPGPGVARVRIAITDIKESKTLQNLVPFSKLAGTGLGGASIEAEIVDSQTGKQIGALLETQAGDRLSFDGLSKWGDTEAVMRGWAKRFRKRLDRAHGK